MTAGSYTSLDVTGAGTSSLTGNVTVGTTAAAAALLVNGTVTATGTSALRGAVTVGQSGTVAPLTVTGTSALQGAVTVGSVPSPANATVWGSVYVMQSATIADILKVTGTLTVPGLTTGGLVSAGSLSSAGGISVTNGGTLRGGITFDSAGTVTLAGVATFTSTASPVSMQGLNATNIAASGTASEMQALSIPGNPSILNSGTLLLPGFAAPSKTSIRSVGTAVLNSGTTAEVQGAFGLTSAVEGFKVALYAGMVAKQGSKNVWSENTVLLIDGAMTNAGTAWVGYGYELDVQNNSTLSFGNSTTLTVPAAYGLAIASQGNNTIDTRISGALLVTGAQCVGGTGSLCTGGTFKPTLNYGAIYSTLSVRQATHFDLSSSWNSYLVGGQHTAGLAFQDTLQGSNVYGIDLNGVAFSGGAIRLGNITSYAGQMIVSRHSSGTYDVEVLAYNGGNNLVIGASPVAGCNSVQVWNDFLPVINDAYKIGGDGQFFTEVWAKDGSINTSMPDLKTDITDLPSMMPIVLQINPKSFRWKSAGFQFVDIEREEEVPVYEEVVESVARIEVRDGFAVKLVEPVTRKVQVFDEIPVVDEAGQQVFAEQPASRAGGPLSIPLTHKVPRLETRTLTKTEPVEREGRRTHLGFMAPDFKAAFDALGIDFAGYVQDSSGVEGLRPAQQVAILWKAVQELHATVVDLDARVSALSANA